MHDVWFMLVSTLGELLWFVSFMIGGSKTFDLSWFNIIVERLCRHLVGMTCAFGVPSSVGCFVTVIELLAIFM